MSEEVSEIDQIGGEVLGHSALITALLGVMQNKGLLSQEDVSQIVDLALVGLENAETEVPVATARARRGLEEFAVLMGGKRRRRR